MKKIISSLLTAIFLVSLSLNFPITSQAKSSDWKYAYSRLYGDKAFIYIGKSKKATLPNNYNDYSSPIVSDTLEELHIPTKVEEVYISKYYLPKLKKITVSNDNKKLKAIEGILYNKKVTKLIAYPYAHTAKKYVIPNTVLKTDAIPGGKNVEEVVIHSKLKIKYNEYINCPENLKTITVNKNNPYLSSVDGVLFNKNKTTLLTYPPAKKGSKYTVPKSVTRVLDLAFRDTNKHLKTLVLPDNIKQFCDMGSVLYEYYDGVGALEEVLRWYHKHLTFVVKKNSKTHNTLKGWWIDADYDEVTKTWSKDFREFGLNIKFKKATTRHPTAPASKTFLKTTLITLIAPSKTTLYYTTDGTKPTVKNAKTVKPGQSRQVKIWKNTTLKVYAARSGYANSDIVTREYKIKSKKPNKTAVPVSKTVKRGKKITLTAPANTTLYYTTNGTTPKRASKTYVKPGKTKPITISKKTTLKVMAVKNGCSRSDVVTRVYKIK